MALRKVGKILLYACAGTLGAVCLLMLAVKLALDRVPHYQAELKSWVHQQIGYHITFTHVSPSLRWFGPELYFEQLELRSKDDRRVLARAAGGRIGTDLWALLHNGKLLAGRVELDGPSLSITRVGPTRFALADELKLGGGDASLPALTLDDLPAGTLAIRGAIVTVHGWNEALPELTLREVNLNLARGEGTAELGVAARLPAVLGGALNVNASVSGLGDLHSLGWTVLAQTHDLSFAGWHALLPSILARLGGGVGGFELAAHGRGAELTRANLDFDAAGVTTQLADEPVVRFEQIAGALTMIHAGDRWMLYGRRMRVLTGGRRDPESEFDVSWRGDDAGLTELRARASYLRAETLLPLTGLLPQKDLRERLQEIEPTGEWQGTTVDFTRPSTADQWQFEIQARFRGVGFSAVGRAPGLRGLNGMIAGTQAGGRIEIDGPGALFSWPQQLPQPVPLETLKTTLYWRRTADELLIATPSITLKNPDAAVSLRAAWHQPVDGSSPVLTVVGGIDDGKVADLHLYIPRLQFQPHTFDWLSRAFVAGHLSHADVVINGPIRQFPFRDGSGLFLARAHIDGMTLDYREGWPVIEDLGTVAEFRNEGLDAKLTVGRLGGLALQTGELRFEDFKTAEMRLKMTAAGDAATALEYLRATPLDASAGHLFSYTEAHGPLVSDVDLFFPFKEFDQRRTRVTAHFLGVSVSRTGAPFAATDLYGDADIDGAQVARADVHGRLLGGPFAVQAREPPHHEPVTRTVLALSGAASGEAVHAALGLPASIPLTGTTEWRGVFRMAAEPTRERSLHLNSTLTGLELNVPEPLAKPAALPMPSSLDITWPSGGATLLRAALGGVVHGQASLETGANGPQLSRLALTFGAAAEPATFSETQIVNTGGVIDRLDLTGWLKLLAPDRSARPPGNLLRSAKFAVGRIDYLGLSFRDVSVDLAASETGWRIGLGGPNVVGGLWLPSGSAAGQPWQLDFQRLKFANASGLPASSAGAPAPDAAPGDGVADPRAVPALSFHAADLIWGERQLGEVHATLHKIDEGVGVDDLTVTGVTFTAAARGQWRGKEGGLGRLEGTLTSTDVGSTLKELGYAEVIDAKSGKLDFDLHWLGAPTGQALSDATGRVVIALDKGQITSLKPGAGRLMGLASFAALPRRLALDFSDLTDKGFSFDTARGSFDLKDGSAFTDDVLVKGPAADIGLIGRVGLKSKDYDQTAVVTGNVGSTLPLAAFAGGPVIGGAVLVFTQVFKQPLRGLARGYYRITGNWDNPTVDRITSADAAAATAEAPKQWEK